MRKAAELAQERAMAAKNAAIDKATQAALASAHAAHAAQGSTLGLMEKSKAGGMLPKGSHFSPMKSVTDLGKSGVGGALARVQGAKEARKVLQDSIRSSLQMGDEVKEAMKSLLMLCLIIVIGAVYYYFSNIDDEEDQIARCQNVGGNCHNGMQKISWVREAYFGLDFAEFTLSSTRHHS